MDNIKEIFKLMTEVDMNANTACPAGVVTLLMYMIDEFDKDKLKSFVKELDAMDEKHSQMIKDLLVCAVIKLCETDPKTK